MKMLILESNLIKKIYNYNILKNLNFLKNNNKYYKEVKIN